MKIDEQMNRLRAFACDDKERSISTVVVKDGIGYATDGRILVAEKLDEEHEDVVSREDKKILPVDGMIRFSKYPDNAKKWFVISSDTKKLENKLSETLRAESRRNDRDYQDRYKLVTCPSCGDDVWFDTWNDKLVEEPEPKDVVTLRDISMPSCIVFGEEKVNVNFAYMFLVMKSYEAAGFNVEFSYGYVDDDHCNRLFFRTADGKMKGVLMPLRASGNESISDRLIQTKEIGDADARTA